MKLDWLRVDSCGNWVLGALVFMVLVYCGVCLMFFKNMFFKNLKQYQVQEVLRKWLFVGEFFRYSFWVSGWAFGLGVCVVGGVLIIETLQEYLKVVMAFQYDEKSFYMLLRNNLEVMLQDLRVSVYDFLDFRMVFQVGFGVRVCEFEIFFFVVFSFVFRLTFGFFFWG